ncbi:uncharacterized protein LOC119771197 isoform X1 [Culex quinquefasciatus]|uniref:uncharacterized protein LOC119771197 isoform X1 n=1 Tax=Culex quinquefasciatus TaxID=7176 RepID=UPI0018E32B95|nr:uncharacterized protein LOC119771197 isoform X1 [Culex quinquefasciatus]
MKIALVILAISTVISYSTTSPPTTPQQICRDREGASIDDVHQMNESRPPRTRVQQCFLDCLYQRLGYSDGRRFLSEGFLRQAMLGAEHDERRRVFMVALARRCDGLVGEDRCQLAADIRACIFQKS